MSLIMFDPDFVEHLLALQYQRHSYSPHLLEFFTSKAPVIHFSESAEDSSK